MLKDVSIEDRFVYDGDISYELYLLYLRGLVSTDYLIRYLKRLVILKALDRYSRLGPEVCEDLVQSALIEVFRAVRNKCIPSVGIGEYHQYLYVIIERWFGKAFETIYDDGPINFPPEEFSRGYVHRFQSTWQVEAALLVSEIPQLLRNRVISTLRLQDPNVDYAGAAEYVVSCTVGGRRIVGAWLRNHFHVYKYKWFVQHVRVRMRMILYEAKELLDLEPQTDPEMMRELLAGI